MNPLDGEPKKAEGKAKKNGKKKKKKKKEKKKERKGKSLKRKEQNCPGLQMIQLRMQHKGLELSMCLACRRNEEEVGVDGAEGGTGVVGEQCLNGFHS